MKKYSGLFWTSFLIFLGLFIATCGLSGCGGGGSAGGCKDCKEGQLISFSPSPGNKNYFQMIVGLSGTNLEVLQGEFFLKGDPLTKITKDILLVRDGNFLYSPYLYLSGEYKLDIYCKRSDNNDIYLQIPESDLLYCEGGIGADFRSDKYYRIEGERVRRKLISINEEKTFVYADAAYFGPPVALNLEGLRFFAAGPAYFGKLDSGEDNWVDVLPIEVGSDLKLKCCYPDFDTKACNFFYVFPGQDPTDPRQRVNQYFDLNEALEEGLDDTLITKTGEFAYFQFNKPQVDQPSNPPVIPPSDINPSYLNSHFGWEYDLASGKFKAYFNPADCGDYPGGNTILYFIGDITEGWDLAHAWKLNSSTKYPGWLETSWFLASGLKDFNFCWFGSDGTRHCAWYSKFSLDNAYISSDSFRANFDPTNKKATPPGTTPVNPPVTDASHFKWEYKNNGFVLYFNKDDVGDYPSSSPDLFLLGGIVGGWNRSNGVKLILSSKYPGWVETPVIVPGKNWYEFNFAWFDGSGNKHYAWYSRFSIGNSYVDGEDAFRGYFDVAQKTICPPSGTTIPARI